MQHGPSVPEIVPIIGGCFGIIIIALTIVAFFVVVHCKIFAKAGLPLGNGSVDVHSDCQLHCPADSGLLRMALQGS
jgi:hypothetical protein